MSVPKLFYVHGYGFALGNKALNLQGDGPLTSDKRTLLEMWEKLIAERDELAAYIKKWEAMARKLRAFTATPEGVEERIAKLAATLRQIRTIPDTASAINNPHDAMMRIRSLASKALGEEEA